MKTTWTILIASAAVSALAALSPAKRDWASGPVQYLMTKEEAAAWKTLDNDAAADDFIALFWARRDPTPGTARNEFHEEFDAKVKFTDAQFSTRTVKGSMTDRGKVFILFGQPLKALNVQREHSIKPGEDAQHEGEAEPARQIWVYEGPSAQKVFNIPHIEIAFVDRFGNGDYRIEPGRGDVNQAMQRTVTTAITQPQLTKAPSFETPKPAQTAAAAAPSAPVEGIRTAALQAAIDAAKAKPASTGAQLGYAEFIAPSGDFYVPVALTVPSSANLALGNVETVFGEVFDGVGAKVAAFEEPARIIEAKSGWFVAHSFDLGTGKYTAYLGVARGGQPLLVAGGPVEVNAIAKDVVGTSKLVLWSDLLILKEQRPPKSPYAFLNLQLVPNPKLTFSNQDELGYFVEINNPGVDSTTLQPKLQMSMELQADGKPISRQPLTEAELIPLSDKPGVAHYAIINSIPLSKLTKPLAPGSYTLKMKVLDTVTKQSYTVQESFKIVG